MMPTEWPKVGEVMSGDGARELFVNLFNEGTLAPAIVSLSDERARAEAEELERQAGVVVVPMGGEEQMRFGMKKMFERFVPTAATMRAETYQANLRQYAVEMGVDIDNLGQHGVAGYFPVGITKTGQLVLEKVRYFDEAVEREILHASAFGLYSERAIRSLSNSVVVSVGLSVGSELLFSALLGGVTSIVMTDPGLLHPDLVGRLGVGYDRAWIGANKALFMRQQILRRYPYARVNVRQGGLNENNCKETIHAGLLSGEMRRQSGALIVLEEADTWVAKKGARLATHALPTNYPWHLLMFADVGGRVLMFHEQEGSVPFLGHVANADPGGDVWGGELARESELKALLASVGGISHITGPLLGMLERGEIGQHEGSRVARVVQKRSDVVLVAAAGGEVIQALAEGQGVRDEAIIDLEPILTGGEKPEDDGARQRALNMKLFGKETI